ncbi:hypothetical protein ACHQM5_012909 [Ranunculus cassubicifolius]
MTNFVTTPLSVIGNIHSRSPSNSLFLVVDFEHSTRNFALFVDSTVKYLKYRVSFKWSNHLSPSLFELSFKLEGKVKAMESDFALQSFVYFATAKKVQYMRVFVMLKHLSSSLSGASNGGSSSSINSNARVASEVAHAIYKAVQLRREAYTQTEGVVTTLGQEQYALQTQLDEALSESESMRQILTRYQQISADSLSG